jgi:AmmeMemoRadiSam system protein B
MIQSTMKPKLREVEAHPIQHQGQPMVLLRDPLHLSDTTIAIPRPLAPLLGLMDGTRDEAALEAALLVRAGVRLAPGLLPKFLADLDTAYMLDNERFAAARAAVLQAYREAPFRPLTLDGASFPTEPDQAAAQLQSYVDALPPASSASVDSPIRGLVSPHIDYQRGGPVYAEVWRAAAEAARQAELVIILGTDHQGSNGTLTLTRQSYASPWGVLPTDVHVVEALAAAFGEGAAFAEELHHRDEHSIELAAVWLHFVRDRRPVPLVPILCGSFAAFVAGEGDPAAYEPFTAAVELLREVIASRRTLVVAAADLAHVGPAFGDPYGLDFVGKAQLRSADERLLETVCAGDAAAFFDRLRAEGDRRHVCGLPPIYLTLRLLDQTGGEPTGYALCPADPQGMSFVTIAGVLLH